MVGACICTSMQCMIYVAANHVHCALFFQELQRAFPQWRESPYAEWIETYSSQDFEVTWSPILSDAEGFNDDTRCLWGIMVAFHG